jgi:hypothetical protein
MTSVRNGVVLCVLLTLALVPTIVHSYVGARVAEARPARALPENLAGFTSTPTARTDAWAARRFDSNDWIERRYERDGQEAILTVVRSYDLKLLYHHPELAAAYGTSFTDYRVAELPERPGVPVHLLTSENDEVSASYVLQYGGGYVADPIAFQIRTAGALLFSKQRPMTLFFMLEHHPPGSSARARKAAAELLFTAIDSVAGPGADAAR